MRTPLLLSLATTALLTTSIHAESMYDKFQALELEMNSLKKEVAQLKAQKSVPMSIDSEKDASENDTEENPQSDEMEYKEAIIDLQESVSEINKATSGSHLKFGIDYRFSLDNLSYTMADKSEANNDAFMVNRLWINMDWSATENLSFVGQLAYSKAFGQRTYNDQIGYNFENFDWVANENPYDDSLRVRSAYFFYINDTFLGAEIPWTFSIGRRPSTNGHLVNLRDDDKAASPMGHTINVEFDGLSSKFSFDNWVDGMYIKLCAGRGMSNAAHKFTSTPYATEKVTNPSIDLLGFIFVPYSNGQYSLSTQYYYANNLIDQRFTSLGVPTQNFDTVGGLHSVTGNFVMNGIGSGISDFLDDTTLFISGAMSQTNPDAGQNMLGGQNSESKVGYSTWVGIQTPSLLTDDGRWGFEYNQGSAYWRGITYGEDTNIGSKLATRGQAYEAYFTEYLIEDILSFQIRYTYIDYEYSGSNGFFGNTTGASMKIADITDPTMAANVVDKAQDIRFYIRYKY
ncbi:MAG: DUF3373 domain-containing protein [Epsilonproteobacteria bacterium]|nr:DUF3373 domain-containing protein [Campylobacterota bacterium]OIO17802.1 MAG: hypothetical protein AUJ81_01000 [Helicobacteraceae bacterium CG1_02_36_14]PIP10500.1 MAG: hypothetical protein COX50_05230 [Sulfurimonas sp. CG23_combo_of_CG06-09_8_20_14_all_36_33]PIS26950.1 MAG: DUF3373 domain-containing protein [Sulfurimonas sp. CG08_land_8_20_14_0_20_36_33]PIU35844.1 MAG: DUF3373 domain-containing protein [Sulfurimonas sp. CG07_land_8_20_14_0_80_36_56]PIV03421.1 MAG: DUF3373 domain-containing